MNNYLIIGDYLRKDLLVPFQGMKTKCNLFFLEYYQQENVINDNYKEYGKIIFWKEFKNAFQLIETNKIDKIIFYAFESYNHIAIRAAAKQLNVKTYHLEHGFRNYDNLNKQESNSLKKNNSDLIILGKLFLKSIFLKDKY